MEWLGERYSITGLDVPVGIDGGAEVLSEIVAFAPFDYLPVTRRPPVVAWALRTKPEFSSDPLPGRTERRGNLASIPMDIPARAFDQLWDKSEELRKELIGENPLVRARVTLPFLRADWAS